MGTTALRQLLRSICSNSEWKYGVLWKLRHGNPTILSWEDGYIDCPKPRQPVDSATEDLYCSRASDVTELNNGSVGLLVSDLSRIQYALGEGLVGHVALTGNHSWVSVNDIFNDEENSVCNFPQEWPLQFASGIKTILVVPLLPLGVLQLGSLEEVAEDISVVASLKGRFNGYHNFRGNSVPAILKRDAEDMLSCSINHLHSPSTIQIKPVKSEDPHQLMALASVKPDMDNIIPALSQFLPLLTEQHVLAASGIDLLEALKYERDIDIDGSSPDRTHEFIPIESLNSSQMDLVENKLLELSSLMEELESYSKFSDFNLGISGESFSEIVNSYADKDAAGILYRGEDPFDADCRYISNILDFPPDSELHKALGPVFREQSRETVWNSCSLVDGTHQSSILTCKQQLVDGAGPSLGSCRGDTEYLLDAVVSKAHSGSDDISSVSNNCKSSPTSSRYLPTNTQAQRPSETSFCEDSDSTYWRHIISECADRNKSTDVSSATLKSMMSTIPDKEHQKGSHDHLQAQKGRKSSDITKRKSKPGNSQKPRPRDRQLIQDRVKELRELVPYSGKCSIDGLLDRTIKHMMYLRSVTEQAEKLKQWALQEATDQKRQRRGTESGNNQHNGTSWAYEFGASPQMCPIVVEDLPWPGHMLIEMLCNEHGLFLEFARVIRGLELTILKGVMESRSSQTWAHFIVEASQGFHRLDIFWPLMQLLQRKRPISTKI